MIAAESTGTLKTIVVKPSGGRLALSEVSTIIHDEGGDLVATAPLEDPAESDAYRLRVHIESVERLVAALAARGHRVLHARPRRRRRAHPPHSMRKNAP